MRAYIEIPDTGHKTINAREGRWRVGLTCGLQKDGEYLGHDSEWFTTGDAQSGPAGHGS